jgi:hypothetical protein
VKLPNATERITKTIIKTEEQKILASLFNL